ncbi:MAG: pyridoxal-phosphate dependent enzyme [Deltaproteobacteria bacterium]|nr:MAG: pyridoxal-phosphate dependent enzyme [Deltaproteobacteria bacterium]
MSPVAKEMETGDQTSKFAFFEAHPRLAQALPRVRLGLFPTPVRRLEKLGRRLGLEHLFLKDDGVSAELYAGNKVRKLEFLLAGPVHQGAAELLTFGYAGSNHAAATAVYARRYGLRSISMLLPQPNAAYVRKNLLVSHASGAELHLQPDVPRLVAATSYQLARHTLERGKRPVIIRAGGSSPLGTVGYVAAAYELAAQIDAGELPEPDVIYVALGSMGTAVGLLLGLRALGLTSRVVGVRVVDERIANRGKARRLFEKTAALLHKADPSFPALSGSDMDLELREEFFGGEYGRFTQSCRRAVAAAWEDEGLVADGTYTGKTLAAVFADAKAAGICRSRVLFWNTYNSRDLSAITRDVDYRELPKPFHWYFEQPVQQLGAGDGDAASS